MSYIYAQRLLQELEATSFPPPREYKYRSKLELYASIRESISDKLQPAWWYDEYDNTRDYVIDPLGERIPEIWHELIFGEEPEFEPKLKGDTKLLEEFVDDNDLPTQLGWAEELNSSEGEVWWRLVSQPELGRVNIEWHSRLNVVPLWIGRNLVAAAFISVLDVGDSKEWVYIEVHAEGVILNRLYFHTIGAKLGTPRPLGDRPETTNLRPQFLHSLDMLCGRLTNKVGRDWRCGISDYQGISGLLLALNEVANIGQMNVRLTAKKRAIIPERFLNSKGELPGGAEILIATEVDMDPDKIKNDFAMIEWEFDAAALIAYKADLVDTILTRARIAPTLIGKQSQSAGTGPSVRAQLIDSQLAALEKAKVWDDQIPKIMSLAFQLESLPLAAGGVGNSWGSTEPPTFKRTDSIPDDPEAVSRRTVMEVNAKVRSRQTAIEQNNPTWGDQRVQEELDRIRQETEESIVQNQQNFGQHDPNGDGPMTASSDGKQGIPDPAGSIPRPPGKGKSTAVADPNRTKATA